MNTDIDWLSVIKRQGSDMPASLSRIISKSDQAFCREDDFDSIAEELLALDCEVSLNVYEYLRIALEVHLGVMKRRLHLALQTDQTIEHCFKLFANLSRHGFESPAAKARMVVILLQYLQGKLTPDELRPLVEAMVDELEGFRVGCEENLSILRTFLKPDDLREKTP